MDLIRALAVVAFAGCATTVIQPGHRGLVFDPRHGGLHHEVLEPGAYRVGSSARIVDYDVTYSTRAEPLKLITSEGLQIDVKLAVIYRPIVAELDQLEGEVGPGYYDEVVGPELRSAAREAFSRRSYVDLLRDGSKLEDEIEVAVRGRIRGKHVELASVTLESVTLPPEIVAAVRARQLAEQNALREKLERQRAAAEADEKWQEEKVELERDVERHELKRRAAP